MDSDGEDFVFYGTPIEREEEITTRKKKAVAEASGQLRTLPAWKQEVRDEEGRRRFHGAFTGGYSAGYYNTVGSKEGWTPQSFTSSRKNRAEVKEQSIFNFLDEDEKTELEGRSLGTSMQFDTFGFTATELARKQAEMEQQKRPSAIPGPVPDEIVAPATESIGVKLLLKMGWRRSRSINDQTTNSLYDIRREAGKAFVDEKVGQTGPEMVEDDIESSTLLSADDGTDKFTKSTPVYVLNPKKDMHGLGYDPFKYAPEFREKKRSRISETSKKNLQKPLSLGDSLFSLKSGRVAPGFGIGALEDLDVEDEDVYAPGYNFEASYVEEIEEPSIPMITDVKRLEKGKEGIPGFKAASISDYQLERFDPPVVPKDFVPRHVFLTPLDVGSKFTEADPPEAPIPEDNNLKILIDGMATLVARCGKLFEDLSREKNQSNPLFAFLFGGNGHDYYARRLWEEKQKHTDQNKRELGGKLTQTVEKMTAETRGKILGEKPLERSIRDSAISDSSAETVNLQYKLSDTFTKPTSLSDLPEAARPFREDPARQERFELFLKEKYHGGLRSKDAGGSSRMSEAARARERLEFEAAVEALEKGKSGRESKTPNQLLTDVLSSSGLQFTAGTLEPAKVLQDEELVKRKRYPKREEFQWRPSPILCKRFDLVDPYMGKPPPAPRSKSKMDTLIFMPDTIVASDVKESVILDRDSPSISQIGNKEKDGDLVEEDIKGGLEIENIERPVDLYKAIFSDDSDDDDEEDNPKQVEDPQRKTEAVNTTLNRLIAGDFLESLGKELGLEVPPDLAHSESKDRDKSTGKEGKAADKGEKEVHCVGSSNSATGFSASGSAIVPETLKPMRVTNDPNDKSGTGTGKKIDNKDKYERVGRDDKKERSTTQLHCSWSSDSSEDERGRKHGHRQRRSNSSDDKSSDDYEDRHRSRTKEKRKRSSQGKSSSSRRRSKHHKHRDRESAERDSRHSSRKERGETKDRRKYKD